MELLEGIETRRSSRAFKSTPIPKDVREKILMTAGRSPSYTNTQPWEVAVVGGQKKDELSKTIFELAKAKAATSSEIPHLQSWPPELEQYVDTGIAVRVFGSYACAITDGCFIYMTGFDVVPCGVVPTEPATWGAIKAGFE